MAIRRDCVPELRDLVHELKGVNWHALGIELDVPTHTLKSIEGDNPTQDRRLSEVLQYWILNDREASWAGTVRALRRIGGHGNIIMTIESKFTLPGPQSQTNVTTSVLRGETLKLKSRGNTVKVEWKQGSFFGFGGDRSQNYILCTYSVSSAGGDVPVYIQSGYSVPQDLTVDGNLQFGMQEGVIFYVLHDKSQKPFQHRFRSSSVQTLGFDLSWTTGAYLQDV